jgi:hypothetical protein
MANAADEPAFAFPFQSNNPSNRSLQASSVGRTSPSLLPLPHVQLRKTENRWRLDCSHRGRHHCDIPRLVDAADVRTLNPEYRSPAITLIQAAVAQRFLGWRRGFGSRSVFGRRSASSAAITVEERRFSAASRRRKIQGL